MKRNKLNRKSNPEESQLSDKPDPIVLLKPRFDSGKSVMKALKERKTDREISSRKLSLQTVSDLLWAAGGINRNKGPFGIPGKTAATASNSQEIDIYAALKEGIYFYEAVKHILIPVVAGDYRALAIGKGQEAFGDKAPARLIYVADINKLVNTSGYREPGLLDKEIQKSYYYADTGLIAGNVYLFAASKGLASWFHNCNKPALTKLLGLNPEKRVLFGHTIGFPEKK